ncbi:hypothetical protein T10_5543 [Trichinella papuae]|uniref:Uncharacterized protein n=1 Tax=Trichinella papuae TaxID=268474 RepID=A0A0V1MVW3_9BILA|nr:hypothetical protein T10_5543 [Trichinella papuae]
MVVKSLPQLVMKFAYVGQQDCDLIAFNFRLQKQTVTSLDDFACKNEFIKKKEKSFDNNSMFAVCVVTTYKLANWYNKEESGFQLR